MQYPKPANFSVTFTSQNDQKQGAGTPAVNQSYSFFETPLFSVKGGHHPFICLYNRNNTHDSTVTSFHANMTPFCPGAMSGASSGSRPHCAVESIKVTSRVTQNADFYALEVIGGRGKFRANPGIKLYHAASHPALTYTDIRPSTKKGSTVYGVGIYAEEDGISPYYPQRNDPESNAYYALRFPAPDSFPECDVKSNQDYFRKYKKSTGKDLIAYRAKNSPSYAVWNPKFPPPVCAILFPKQYWDAGYNVLSHSKANGSNGPDIAPKSTDKEPQSKEEIIHGFLVEIMGLLYPDSDDQGLGYGYQLLVKIKECHDDFINKWHENPCANDARIHCLYIGNLDDNHDFSTMLKFYVYDLLRQKEANMIGFFANNAGQAQKFKKLASDTGQTSNTGQAWCDDDLYGFMMSCQWRTDLAVNQPLIKKFLDEFNLSPGSSQRIMIEKHFRTPKQLAAANSKLRTQEIEQYNFHIAKEEAKCKLYKSPGEQVSRITPEADNFYAGSDPDLTSVSRVFCQKGGDRSVVSSLSGDKISNVGARGGGR